MIESITNKECILLLWLLMITKKICCVPVLLDSKDVVDANDVIHVWQLSSSDEGVTFLSSYFVVISSIVI